ncbi:hypothetical protein GCM10008955_16880 [Deinococcus malanensis]|uniref:precorrin-2 dehydrogenase n=2 Tax=Deinococcus malanensis TaxID=1706855 RepID=A0ABQ2ESA0_9DEIO|nr:hypothetical protein GCM10008955_16880 [Deinococcus malanensis]
MLRLMRLLAAFLDLSGQPAVVAGGGPVALRRTRTLLEAGLQVTVVAPQIHAEFSTLPVTVVHRHCKPDDLRGARVVVAATNDPAVNERLCEAAQKQGALVNHAGDAARGTLRFPAVVSRGGLQVAVSTGRELPVLAQALGDRITTLLPDEPTLDQWSRQREEALREAEPARELALQALREDIRTTLGVPA